MNSMFSVRTIISIAVLTAIISFVGLDTSSRYERTDGPTVGSSQEIKPLPDQELTGDNCNLVNYIKGPEKVQGWPYVTKRIVNDTYCGAYPDLYYPDSRQANIAIIIVGSGVVSALLHITTSRAIRTNRRPTNE